MVQQRTLPMEKVGMPSDDSKTMIQVDKRYSSSSKPLWLLSTLSDLDERIRVLVLNSDQSDTFAKRAESYYQQRPKLLALLLDLYNNYLSLADRYCLFLHNHTRHGPTSSSELFSGSSSNHLTEEECQSDAESSLSYQVPSVQAPIFNDRNNNVNDDIITELVMKNVEYDMMAHELGLKEREPLESSRKIELQKSLLEVLESERMILLNENAGLKYKVNVLVEENKGLASESMFMKRKASELARCVLNTRNDYRVCTLGRKIEELQGKIYGLEKRNREYYAKVVELEKGKCLSCEEEGSVSNSEETWFEGNKDKERCVEKKGVKFSKWWNKFKTSDMLFLCKPSKSSLA